MAKKNKPFVLSDGSKTNSHGFRIDLTGLLLDRFNLNPVMLYMHDPNQLIGQWENLKVDNNKLFADPDFDLEDENAKIIAGKVERGYLKGASLGIVILEMKEIGGEYVATKSELIEASVVPVPSDAGAIRLYDENSNELTFEQVKLKYIVQNPKKTTKMDENEKKEMQQQLAEKDNEITQLKAKLAESEKEKVASFLQAGVAAGKITEKEVPGLAKLAEKDFATVKELVDSREGKASTTLSEQVQRPAGGASSSSTGRESWTYLQWMKEDTKGLQKMKTENPTEFAKLQQTLK